MSAQPGYVEEALRARIPAQDGKAIRREGPVPAPGPGDGCVGQLRLVFPQPRAKSANGLRIDGIVGWRTRRLIARGEDPATVLGLFDKRRHRAIFEVQNSVTARRLHGGEGCQAPSFSMGGNSWAGMLSIEIRPTSTMTAATMATAAGLSRLAWVSRMGATRSGQRIRRTSQMPVRGASPEPGLPPSGKAAASTA